MKLESLLRKELVLFSNLKNKKDNLESLIHLVSEQGLVKDSAGLRQALFSREDLMSTGIGLGLAIPHVRFDGVDDMIVAININKDGIRDYESMDGSLVRIVILIIAGELQHKQYLKLLSQIVKILKKDAKIDKLLDAKTPEEVVDLLSNDLEGISNPLASS